MVHEDLRLLLVLQSLVGLKRDRKTVADPVIVQNQFCGGEFHY